jgi:hypothetical protein
MCYGLHEPLMSATQKANSLEMCFALPGEAPGPDSNHNAFANCSQRVSAASGGVSGFKEIVCGWRHLYAAVHLAGAGGLALTGGAHPLGFYGVRLRVCDRPPHVSTLLAYVDLLPTIPYS